MARAARDLRRALADATTAERCRPPTVASLSEELAQLREELAALRDVLLRTNVVRPVQLELVQAERAREADQKARALQPARRTVELGASLRPRGAREELGRLSNRPSLACLAASCKALRDDVQPLVRQAAPASPREIGLRRMRSLLLFFDVDMGPFHAGRFVVKMLADACPAYCEFLFDACSGRWGTPSNWMRMTNSSSDERCTLQRRDGVPLLPGFLSMYRFGYNAGGGENFALGGREDDTIFSLPGFSGPPMKECVALHRPSEAVPADENMNWPWPSREEVCRKPWLERLASPSFLSSRQRPEALVEAGLIPAAAPPCRMRPATAANTRAGSVFLDLQHGFRRVGQGQLWFGTYWAMYIVAEAPDEDARHKVVERLRHAHPIGEVVEGRDILALARREQAQCVMENLPLYGNRNGVRVVRCGVL